jgi:hypothetical protein
MLQTDSRRVGDEKLVTVCPLHLKPLMLTRRMVIRNAPAPPPSKQPKGMGDLLFKSRRGMAVQERLICSGDLGQIEKIPA